MIVNTEHRTCFVEEEQDITYLTKHIQEERMALETCLR